VQGAALPKNGDSDLLELHKVSRMEIKKYINTSPLKSKKTQLTNHQFFVKSQIKRNTVSIRQ
jgi:hypothetical protein